jgi:Zn-dependent M28 family amino/carboxypeptidase
VVVSAHIDGHPLAESAIDNATGLAAALAIARALGPIAGRLERGIRICLFNLEEWGVAGSARYLDAMAPADRDAIALNVNLDAIAGDPALTALTSDFPALDGFLPPIAQALGLPLGLHAPLMANSDHAHFARHGIPALRLVAGFNQPDSALRLLLTPADRSGIVDPVDLVAATQLAAAIVLTACSAPSLDLRRG